MLDVTINNSDYAISKIEAIQTVSDLQRAIDKLLEQFGIIQTKNFSEYEKNIIAHGEGETMQDLLSWMDSVKRTMPISKESEIIMRSYGFDNIDDLVEAFDEERLANEKANEIINRLNFYDIENALETLEEMIDELGETGYDSVEELVKNWEYMGDVLENIYYETREFGQ